LLILVLVCTTLFVYYLWHAEFNYPFKGEAFCEDNGYDGVDWANGGIYSEKFGKVKCISCYGGECVTEEFNVTTTLGIIHKIKHSVNEGEAA